MVRCASKTVFHGFLEKSCFSKKNLPNFTEIFKKPPYRFLQCLRNSYKIFQKYSEKLQRKCSKNFYMSNKFRQNLINVT